MTRKNSDVPEEMAEEISQAPEEEFDLVRALEVLKKEERAKLFYYAMQGEWNNVIKTYKYSYTAQKAIITKSKETALHLAISDAPSNVAIQLIDLISDVDSLSIQNHEGNTPLHLAAELGMIKVCELIANKNGNAVISRNQKGETPIFLAALKGHEETFFWLSNHSPSLPTTDLSSPFKRNDGDTVLHVTIAAEYFKLAIRIIQSLPICFVDYMNKDGLTPLHMLAAKPDAFKSSTHYGLRDRILYYCVVVDEKEDQLDSVIEARRQKKSATGLSMKELDVPAFDTQRTKERDTSRNEESQNYPGNYDTCVSFFTFPKVIIEKLKKKGWLEVFCSSFQDNNGRKNDAENPKQNFTSSVQGSKRRKIRSGSERSRLWPFVLVFKLLVKALLIILGAGWRINKIRRKKQLHVEAKTVMKYLVGCTNMYENYAFTGLRPEDFNHHPEVEDAIKEVEDAIKEVNDQSTSKDGRQNAEGKSSGDMQRTPILIAANFGVMEMVQKILEMYPVAIRDTDSEGKNVVLLAVQNRQTHVYEYFLRKFEAESKANKALSHVDHEGNGALWFKALSHVDHEGNGALHLAAFPCDEYRPWHIPGSAFQMQWEVMWFQYVKQSVPELISRRPNKRGEPADKIFVKQHKEIREQGSKWLIKTCESCSVVAALVAGVAFSATSSVPGGVDEKKGTPTLEQKPAFNFFAISSLAALCSSITALVIFLSILTSRYQDRDFAKNLPGKLLLGLTTLFASIASMLVSFCSGHVFILNHGLRYIAYPLYAGLCIPVTFFAFSQLRLYFDIFSSILRRAPLRGYEVRV